MTKVRLILIVSLLLPSVLTAAQETDSLSLRNAAIEEVRQLKNSYKFEEALDRLSSLQDLFGNDETILSETADCHFQNGNYENACLMYIILSKINPQKIMYDVRQMLCTYRMKNYPSAIALGKTILRRDTIPALISLVGDSYNYLKQTDSAIVYYTAALSVKPSNESVVNKLAKIYLDREEYDKAISVTDSLLVLDPDNMTVAPIKGLSLFLKGDYDPAIEILERQLKLGNDSYGVHYYLGQSYWQTNVMYRAEEELVKAWQIDSSDVNLALIIAAVKSDSHDSFDTGIKPWLDRAAEMLEPDHATLSRLHQLYGRGYYGRHDGWEKAISHYKEAYRYNPKFISALSTTAYCYEQLKDFKTAIEWYKKYLAVAKTGSNGYDFAKGRLEDLEAELFMQEK